MRHKRIVLNLLFAFVSWAALANAASPTPDSSAQTIGQQIGGQIGTGSDINNRLATPLMSNSAQMKTLDGTTFNAQMLCPSSNAFLKLQVLTDGAGNISMAVFQQDTNMDGTIDNTYQVPYLVTSVCANGIWSCTTCSAAVNGCTGCSQFKWVADPAGKLGLTAASPTELGGCHCINNNCLKSATTTSNTIQNMNVLLPLLGGGAVGAIQTTLPQTAISDPKTDAANLSISYFGQSSGSCASVSAYGSSSPQQYYNPTNGNALTNAASTEQGIQSNDPNSIYSMASNVVGKTQGGSYIAPCTVTRNYAVNTTNQTVTGTFTKSGVNSAADVQLQYGITGSQYHFQILTPPMGGVPGSYPAWTTDRSVDMTGMTVMNILLCGNTLWIDPSCNSQGATSTISRCYPSAPMPLSVSGCDVVGNHTLDLNYNYAIDYKFDTPSEVLDDKCSAFANDANCRLQSETYFDTDNYGIVTYNNFNPTGYSTPDTCKDIVTTIGTYHVCRPWWKIARSYLCTNAKPIDISKEKDISRQAYSSTAAGSSYASGTLNMNYSVNGQSYSSTYNNIKDSTGKCEWVCKTSVPVQNTANSLTASTSQVKTTTDSDLNFYRLCKQDLGGNYTVCPVESPQETIIDACQCQSAKNQSAFGPAVAAMEAISQAGNDLICSDGTKK